MAAPTACAGAERLRASADCVGASVGDAHFVFTLADMGTADGENLGVLETDRKKFIRLDDAKGKVAPPSGALWFERVGVMMTYGLIGEEVGVLVPRSFEPSDADNAGSAFTKDQAREVLKEVERRFEAGAPFSHSPQGRARYLGHYLARHLVVNRRAAEKLIAD